MHKNIQGSCDVNEIRNSSGENIVAGQPVSIKFGMHCNAVWSEFALFLFASQKSNNVSWLEIVSIRFWSLHCLKATECMFRHSGIQVLNLYKSRFIPFQGFEEQFFCCRLTYMDLLYEDILHASCIFYLKIQCRYTPFWRSKARAYSVLAEPCE